jgi:hypothetical protein
MSWIPRWHHVTQLHPGADGGLSGWNDCWEACLARYLRERNPQVTEGDDWELISAVSWAARAAPDAPGNPYTSLDQAARSLHSYGVEGVWTESFAQTSATPWAICLVDGTSLTPAQYPAAWFGDAGPGGDHFILWLPFWQGSACWFNDPLSYTNGQQDCRYDRDSVAAAFTGAYLLPNTGNGETGPIHMTVLSRCALKTRPNHTCIALTGLDAGALVTLLPEREGGWQRVRTAAGMSGWVLRANLGTEQHGN